MFEAGGGYAKEYSTHTEIIDRLEPLESWKIVVVGVSSVCKSEGLHRPQRCQRNLKSTVRKAFRSFDVEGAPRRAEGSPYMLCLSFWWCGWFCDLSIDG